MDYAIGVLLLAATCLTSEPGESWKSAGFARRLSDGSTATLECCKWAECTTRITARVEEARKYQSSTETLYVYRLVLERDGTKKTVWEKTVLIGLGLAGVYPEFSVKDVEIVDGRLYILYAFGDGHLNLVVYEKPKGPGPWVYLVCWRLDDYPRWGNECHLVNDAGRPYLRCLTRDRGSREERWDILWNADGVGTLRKRK